MPTLYASCQEEMQSIVDKEYEFAILSNDGKSVYCYTPGESLFKYKLTDKGIGTKKKISDNVYQFSETKNGDVFVVTTKDSDMFVGTYKRKYSDINQLSNDYYCSYHILKSINNSVYFYQSKNEKRYLIKYNVRTKNLDTINNTDNYTEVDIRSDDMCYYLKDGKLYLKKGNKKPKLIDEDVKEAVTYKFYCC